ncbi:MAG: LPS export ABC transporter periplasmic protein LptC [Rhodospirillales bacterium]|nr:LPS export ABC transporter periplasmic protein LptC [Rhodospirillales bacterium]
MRAERRRRLFRILRIGLPTATALIIVVALFWPQLIGQRERIDIAVPPTATEGGTPPEAVVNAKYSGVDRAGRPFEIRAKSVRNPEGEQQALQLMKPDAQIALKDGTLLTIEAASGLFRRDDNQLDLRGDVTLRRGPDLTVRTDEATIHLADSTASGNQAVDATSSQGTLSGTGFRIEDAGDTVFVTGPARMQVDEHAADPGRR